MDLDSQMSDVINDLPLNIRRDLSTQVSELNEQLLGLASEIAGKEAKYRSGKLPSPLAALLLQAAEYVATAELCITTEGPEEQSEALLKAVA